MRKRGHQACRLEGAFRSDEPLGHVQQGLGRRRGQLGGRAGSWRQVHEEELVRAGVALRERAKGCRDSEKTCRGIRISGEGLELVGQVLEGRGADRSDECPTIGEPLVQGRSSNADAFGDGEHRDRVEAAGLEDLSTGGHDVVVRGAGPSGAHAFVRPIRPRCVSWNELGNLRP